MPTICYNLTIDYDFPLQQRPMHLMNILSKRGWKVYWVNNTQRTDKVRDRINDNLEVYHNWEVFKKRVPAIDVYFSSWSHRHVDLDQIKSKIVLYDSLDNFEENENEEINMINKSDIVLTTSSPLYEIRSKQHNNVHMCRNACFSELGNKEYDIPNDIKNLKKPLILFSGALSASWCDLELVEKIAKQYTLIVVGKGWGINKMPKGVIYLGEKKYEQLQAYYHHCDINILPFLRCQVADFSNPIKNYEAMSHGKITVSTDIPEATIYPGAVIPSENHKQFLHNVEVALSLSKKSETVQKCKQYANENDWNNRVDIIEKSIYDFTSKKGISL